jgi:hypothetical protein
MADTSSEDYKVSKIETKIPVVKDGKLSIKWEVETFDSEETPDQQAPEQH